MLYRARVQHQHRQDARNGTDESASAGGLGCHLGYHGDDHRRFLDQNVVVVDDAGTPGLLGDDFSPMFVGGYTDADSELDVGEIWTSTANAAALAGEYVNIATVNGTAADEFGNTAPSRRTRMIAIPGSSPTSTSSRPRTVQTTSAQTCWWAPAVTWGYTVTTTGDVSIQNVVVVDDAGTPGLLGDDFNPMFVSGDTDLDSRARCGRIWTYTANAAALAGEYVDIATVNGTAADDSATRRPSRRIRGRLLYRARGPNINIVKTTNGTDDVCPDVLVSSTVTWGYTVTTTSDVSIQNVVVVDDAGTPGLLSDDFSPMFVGGDTDGDSELDVGEIWTYTANGSAQLGEYVNIATVNGTAADEFGNTAPVKANEDDCYTGLPPDAPGNGMTPGFWKNHVAISNQELDEYQEGLSLSSSYQDRLRYHLEWPSQFRPNTLPSIGSWRQRRGRRRRPGRAAAPLDGCVYQRCQRRLDEDAEGPGIKTNLISASPYWSPTYPSSLFSIRWTRTTTSTSIQTR